MRDIKFRGFNTEDEHMDYFSLDKDFDFDDYRKIFKGHYELMQYTGLKDKDEKEIYEGDIIEICSNRDNILLKEKIEWVDGMGCYNITTWMMYNGLGKDLQDKDAMNVEFKVIGNIYENGELLTKK